MQSKIGKKVITGVVTISNVHVWHPISISGSQPIYTATILISKHDTKTLEGVNLAIENAVQNGLSVYRGLFRKRSLNNLPLHDFTEDADSPFYGYYVLNAASIEPPKILDHQVFPITDHSAIGDGSRVRIALTFFPAVKEKYCCVGCMLGNIQKSFTKETKNLPLLDFDWCHDEFLRVFYERKKES